MSIDWIEDVVLWWCEVCVCQSLPVHHSRDLCAQWLQEPVSVTFSVISAYGCISGPYTNEQPPEDNDLLIGTYAGACISFNINYSNSALVGIY
jgi:hypothetical protein